MLFHVWDHKTCFHSFGLFWPNINPKNPCEPLYDEHTRKIPCMNQPCVFPKMFWFFMNFHISSLKLTSKLDTFNQGTERHWHWPPHRSGADSWDQLGQNSWPRPGQSVPPPQSYPFAAPEALMVELWTKQTLNIIDFVWMIRVKQTGLELGVFFNDFMQQPHFLSGRVTENELSLWSGRPSACA